MSDNEHQPPTPQLTRRQLRELRNTASTPIIVDPGASDEAGATGAEQPPVSAPLPRAAEPAEVPPAPVPQASVDLGAPALTRRQARLQEKIRTASIPVITATGEHAALSGHAEHDTDAFAPAAGEPAAGETEVDSVEAPLEPEAFGDAETRDAETAGEEFPDAQGAPDGAGSQADQLTEADELTDAERADDDSVIDATIDDEPSDEAEHHDDDTASAIDTAFDEDAEVEHGGDGELASEDDADAEPEAEVDSEPGAEAEAEPEPEVERHVVSEDLGADLLAGDAIATDVPASFDQLLSRSAAATGAFTAPNALILTQTPDGGPLVAPVTATGEVLITGTFALPEHFGSTGVIPGSADGKEVDAVLLDGELPASSSPTPIAASAAISTIKSAEDVIRPPAPEKGSRWTVALAITAGALAVLLAGVLVVALVTGVFQ